jgi:hypothetical protein
MPVNGAALNASGVIFLSGSAESDDATNTDSMLGCAQGGAPYDESNISSAYKTNTSLTTMNTLINAFDNNGSCDGSAPHGMEECRGAYDQSGGGGR